MRFTRRMDMLPHQRIRLTPPSDLAPEPKVPVNLSLDASFAEHLKAVAKRNGSTVSGLVQRVLGRETLFVPPAVLAMAVHDSWMQHMTIDETRYALTMGMGVDQAVAERALGAFDWDQPRPDPLAEARAARAQERADEAASRAYEVFRGRRELTVEVELEAREHLLDRGFAVTQLDDAIDAAKQQWAVAQLNAIPGGA